MNISMLLDLISSGGDILNNVKAKAEELQLKIIDPVPEDIDISTAEEGLYDDTILFEGQPYNLTIKENTDTQYGTDALMDALSTSVNYVDHSIKIEETPIEARTERRFDTISEVELDDFFKGISII